MTGLTAASGGTAVAGECSTTTAANVPIGTYILGKLISNSTTAGSTALVIVRPSWFGQVPSVRAVTSSPDTILNTDCQSGMVTYSSTSAIAVTLPQAGTTGFLKGCTFYVQNLNTGTVTITPTTSAIYYNAGLGTTSLALTQGQGATIRSDGTNYSAVIGGSSGGGSTPIFTLHQTGISMLSGTGTITAITGTGCTSGVCTVTTPPADGTYSCAVEVYETAIGTGTCTTAGVLAFYMGYTNPDSGAVYALTGTSNQFFNNGASILQSFTMNTSAPAEANDWKMLSTDFRAKSGVPIKFQFQQTTGNSCTTATPQFGVSVACYGPKGY